MRTAIRAMMPLTIVAMMLLAIVTVLTAQGAGAQPISPAYETSPPRDCPPGWVKAEPPWNPALGCVSNTLSASIETPVAVVFEHPGHCPEGWVQATAPLNDELGCINNTIAAVPETTPTPCSSPTGCLKANTSVKQVVVNERPFVVDDLTNKPCPEGSAIHPSYIEYGCIPYGAGPWAE